MAYARSWALVFVVVVGCKLDSTPPTNDFDLQETPGIRLMHRADAAMPLRAAGNSAAEPDAAHSGAAGDSTHTGSAPDAQPADMQVDAALPVSRESDSAGRAAPEPPEQVPAEPRVGVGTAPETLDAGPSTAQAGAAASGLDASTSADAAQPAPSGRAAAGIGGAGGAAAPSAGRAAPAAGTGAAGTNASPNAPSDALFVAVLQVVFELARGGDPTPAVARLLPLLISEGALPPESLGVLLGAIADADACSQSEAADSCKTICSALATRCQECASDNMCRSQLQRVCGRQIQCQ